ncbi:AAA family ATPase [Streptomyces sp. YS-B37]|uniref:AAA family ATPase n=1 Tax=Streptomyces sp. YS-B37 TaxID=3407669 RepID=UPI003B501650
MITRIEIDGFKTFDRFSLDVPPFLVLLGANSSGKSNLLEAVALLGHLVRKPSSQTLVRHARRGGPQELFRRRPDGGLVDEMRIGASVLLETERFGLCHVGVDARIEYQEAPEPLRVQLSIGGVGSHGLPLPERVAEAVDEAAPYVFRKGVGEDPALDGAVSHALDRAVDGWRLLDPLPEAMRQVADAYDTDALTEDGGNLGAVLGRLWGAAPDRKTAFEADVAAVLPDVRKIDVEQDTDRAQWDVWIQHKNEPRMSPRVVSGGTLRVLALLAAAHDPAHPGVLMIEEPENGLHPNRVPRLLERLKERATDLAAYRQPDRDGSTGYDDHDALRQIIVTSHSPVVLASLLDKASRDVVFLDTVTRLERGQPPTRLTRARRVDEDGERGTYVTPMEVRQYLDPVGYAHGA